MSPQALLSYNAHLAQLNFQRLCLNHGGHFQLHIPFMLPIFFIKILLYSQFVLVCIKRHN